MLESNVNKSVLGDCTILEADDGCTALDVMRTETEADRAIDFVLMDYVMIRMNRAEDESGRGVVIGITGNALPEDLDNFRDHGANVVLTKPLTNAKLMDAMRQRKETVA
jgi:CheY-like chemotaxis protein